MLNGTFTAPVTEWTLVPCQVASGFTGHSYYFNQTNCAGGISQSVATTPGATYTISFDLNIFGGGSNWFAAYFGGINPVFSTVVNNYAPLTFTTGPVVATGSNTELTFLGNSPTYAMQLDNVRMDEVVTATPEPGSTILMATGLLALAGITVQRRRKVQNGR